MLDYEIEMYAPGRRCPLTEERCFSNKCKSSCYGLDIKNVLQSMSTGDLNLAVGAVDSIMSDLSDEMKNAIIKSLNEGQGSLNDYEDFMDELLK